MDRKAKENTLHCWQQSHPVTSTITTPCDHPFQRLLKHGKTKIFTRENLDGCKIAYINYYKRKKEKVLFQLYWDTNITPEKKKALAAYIIYGKSIKLLGLFSFRDYKQNWRTKSILTAVCFAFLAFLYFKFKEKKKKPNLTKAKE